MPTDTPSETWIESALKVTGHFEDSEDPMGAVSGDFDGMGISLGVLQWNIGQGSLQPLVRAIGRAAVVNEMSQYGVDLWNACNSAIPQGLSIVRGWQVGTKLRTPVFRELKTFTHSGPFVAQQIGAAKRVATEAFAAAEDWSRQASNSAADKGLFCWFFDLYTQNGGLKDVTYPDAKQFIAATGTSKVDDIICDWLMARTAADAGFKDSHRNAQLWRDNVPPEKLVLFTASYLRALESRTEYRGDTLNRKATIALGDGWVHQERHALGAILSG